MMKSLILLILCIIGMEFARAGSLNSPALAAPVSYWKSFNNKKFQLCKMKNKKRIPRKITNKVRVHFDNNSHELSESEENKILKGFKKYFTPEVTNVEIVGYADILGSDHDNLRLSHSRLTSVIDFINFHRRELFTHSFNLMTDYKGERKSTAHQRKDRYVEIRFISFRPLTENIKRIYLVDGSYSMKTNRTVTGYSFNDLRRMDIPKDTLVYVVRDNIVGCAGEDISKYTPEGRTYVREAMGIFAYEMRGKIKFVTFTDAIEELSAAEENFIENYITQSKEKYGIKWFVL